MRIKKPFRPTAIINEKAQKLLPGPGTYFETKKHDPKKKIKEEDKDPKLKERGIKFKDYQKLLKEKRVAMIERMKEESGRMTEMLEKVKGGVPKYTVPLPADKLTFERISQLSGELRKKKGGRMV